MPNNNINLLPNALTRMLLWLPYHLCLQLVATTLGKHRGVVWQTIFATAAAITLVPAHLLEPRYFTPAIALLLLNTPFASTNMANFEPVKARITGGTTVGLWAVLVACYLVNAATLFVFLYRPFTWHDGTVARFMY